METFDRTILRKAQETVLRAFSGAAKTFALAGGTALELFYLHHRFSADLDFFSPDYDRAEIDKLVSILGKQTGNGIRLESEFIAAGKAKVRFYTMPVKGSNRPLKIDFVEDVVIKSPAIAAIKGTRVYSAENIYLHKIAAIAGLPQGIDDVGREIAQGRNEARDVFDLYMLSKKIQPLPAFLKTVPPFWQRGMVHWYRRFSRQGLKLALLDLNIYDPQFNSRDMIVYLESEIKQFMQEVIE